MHVPTKYTWSDLLQPAKTGWVGDDDQETEHWRVCDDRVEQRTFSIEVSHTEKMQQDNDQSSKNKAAPPKQITTDEEKYLKRNAHGGFFGQACKRRR